MTSAFRTVLWLSRYAGYHSRNVKFVRATEVVHVIICHIKEYKRYILMKAAMRATIVFSHIGNMEDDDLNSRFAIVIFDMQAT